LLYAAGSAEGLLVVAQAFSESANSFGQISDVHRCGDFPLDIDIAAAISFSFIRSYNLSLNNLSPTQQAFREQQRLRVNYSAIARELGVTPQHVRLVALGRATSARVLKRLDREWRRIEREAKRAA
jgi:hypothetical protein